MPVRKGLEKGSKLAPLSERLKRLGLVSDWDFVLHLPLRYEDETKITHIADIREGQTVQIQGKITNSRVQRGRFEQLIASVQDDTDEIRIRFLHFYLSQQRQLSEGRLFRFYGTVRKDTSGMLEILHPKVMKPIEAGICDLPKTLTPVYPSGESVTQHWLRKRIDRALLDVDLSDLVPRKYTPGLPDLRTAILSLHHPQAGADQAALDNRVTPAWQRLKFDELLAQQITLFSTRALKKQNTAPKLPFLRDGLIKNLLTSLEFQLTAAQKRVFNEISSDLEKSSPMMRLLQGDVGSGKTIIAMLTALQAIDNHKQVALMAPTEILAQQHYKKIAPLLSSFGIRVALLLGSQKNKEKSATQTDIAEGKVDFVIGTHALISEAVNFNQLALAIIDEQHRFGVGQRHKLRNSETGEIPHMLMLSATPIPRTLAMSYLADIDVSVIDELPPGRTPVTTTLISIERIDEMARAIDRTIAEKKQCYWVCPLIEESEKADLSAATERAQYLKAHFPFWRIALVHGALASEEKNRLMQEFKSGHIDVLVSTTVVEVGVDVPNASLMVIEQAERFGLAQLHQLRGRVGRGATKSHCVLLYSAKLSETARARLKIIHDTTDGFAIAQADLKLRGPGEFLGVRQSGVPLLRFADLDTDALFLSMAQSVAQSWLAEDKSAALKFAKRWYTQPHSYLEA